MKISKYFKDIKNVTMPELVNWFQIEYTELADDMKNSNHNSKGEEPNSYHLEDGVWTHTMMVCLQAQHDDIVVKLVALLHDIGKPMARIILPWNKPKPDYNGEARTSQFSDEVKVLEDNHREFKIAFRGHEGISAWMSLDPLKTLQSYGVITEMEVNEVFKSISLHSNLFNRIKDGNEHKPEQIVNLFDDIIEYNNFVKACRNDSTGRFHIDNYEQGRSDTGVLLGKTLYNVSTYLDNVKEKPHIDVDYLVQPTVTVLCGLPCSGKDTFLMAIRAYKSPNTVVISKDDVIMEIAEERGLTYSETFKILTKDEHAEAYAETMRRFYKAREQRKDIYINLTNMSKKSRTKYIHDLKKYKKEAIVFMVGLSEIDYRNNLRNQETGKWIPKNVYKDMMRAFLVPTLLEFDKVTYYHN